MFSSIRRALVGFSSPVGYSYQYLASKTSNDKRSSPNPVLMGATGLFVLYDEIWFACRSLCPENMRALPYVRFLDIERPDIIENMAAVIADSHKATFPGEAGINDLFPDGYDGMRRFFPANGKVDNHTHGLSFGNGVLNGNLGTPQLAIDTWLISSVPELRLELVLNPVTAKLAFAGNVDTWPLNKESYNDLVLSDGIISLDNLYDFTGPLGPHHSYAEDLRQDDLVKEFRSWIKGQRGRLDNQTLQQIQEEVDARVYDLTKEAFKHFSERYRLKKVAIRLIRSTVAPQVPWNLVDFAGLMPSRNSTLAYTFVAKAKYSQAGPNASVKT